MTGERYFEVIEDYRYGFKNITEEEKAEMHTTLLHRALEGFYLTDNEMCVFYKTYNFVDMIENLVDGRICVDIIYEFDGKYYRTSMYYDDYDGFNYYSATPFEEVEFKKVVIEVEKWVPKEGIMKRYVLIWEDEKSLHEIDYSSIETLLSELHMCLEIDAKHNQLCNYKIEVKEV